MSEGSEDWLSRAVNLLAEAWGMPTSPVWQSVATAAGEHKSKYGLTTPVDVTRAALARLDDWPGLDAAGRAAAIENEMLEHRRRETNAVIAAVNRHGLPVAAPELHPPLTTTWHHTDWILQMLVHAAGWLVETGEERDGWAVYTKPRSPTATGTEHAPTA